MSLTAHEDWELHQVDIVGVYLQGDLDEEIYVEVSKGVNIEGKEGLCWRLRKSLYGLKQSGHQWKKKLDEVIKELDFEKANTDECPYILWEDGKISLLVLVHINNMALTSNSITTIRKFKDDLSKHFDITDLGDLRIILGIQVTRDRPNGIIYLDQTAYIQSVLSHFGMQDCNPVSPPLDLKERPSISQCPTNEDEKSIYRAYAKVLNYLEVVGSILYATQTRPDLQYTWVGGPCMAGHESCLGSTKENSLPAYAGSKRSKLIFHI